MTAGVANIAPWAVPKTLFLDIVDVLKSDPVNMAATDIPANSKGSRSDRTSWSNGANRHTLWVANDNDFLTPLPPAVGTGDNPNQLFVFAFDDNDLPFFEPQRFHRADDDDHDGDHDHGQDRR